MFDLRRLLTTKREGTSDLLTALSRSRHFRSTESAVAPEIRSPRAAQCSQVRPQKTGPHRCFTRKSF